MGSENHPPALASIRETKFHTTGQLILALGTVGDPITEPLKVQAQLGSRWVEPVGMRSTLLCSCAPTPLALSLGGAGRGSQRHWRG